jgi:hypothetical protein
MLSYREMIRMTIYPRLLLFLSAYRVWLPLPRLHRHTAGCQLLSDYGGSGSYPGRHEFHAAVYVIHATVHLYNAAGGSLH